jgi:glycosyltransferase involved in cell wall biosynthesis
MLTGYSGSISGGDEHALQLINLLADEGRPSKVVIPADAYLDRVPDIVERINIPLLPLENHLRKSKLTLLLVYIWRIVYTSIVVNLKLRNCNYRLILSSHLFHDVWPVLFLKSNSRIFVYFYHLISDSNKSSSVSASISNFLEGTSISVLHRRNLGLITSSPKILGQLSEIFVQSEVEFLLTMNGINSKLLTKAQDGFRDFDIVFIGRLVERKGILDLLQALSNLTELRPLKVAIVGNGPLLSEVKSIADGIDTHSINVLGSVSEETKFEVLQNSKTLVLPSYEEGWGIVIGEALAAGCNVIAYSLEQISPIWGEAVTWVESGSIDALSESISRMVDHGSSGYGERSSDYWITKLDWIPIISKEIGFMYFDEVPKYRT